MVQTRRALREGRPLSFNVTRLIERHAGLRNPVPLTNPPVSFAYE